MKQMPLVTLRKAPSYRNMPRGGLENKSLSKIERAGISLG